MNKINLIVEGADKRLDLFITEHLKDYSRSCLQGFIKAGQITVNGLPQRPSYRVKRGERIELILPESPDSVVNVFPQEIPLNIVYEDDSIVVINKPAGLLVHPGKGQPDGTLVNALVYHFEHLSDINGVLRPGIVHRLDQDTTGLMVIAKSNVAHHRLAEQFEKRTVEKTYMGIVWGTWKEKAGVINQPIARKRSDPTTFGVSITGRSALTEYKVVHQNRYLSYVQFQPRTGRTHQIRVHSAHIGHPIFADEKYNGGLKRVKGYIPEIANKLKALIKSIGRHALHAQKLAFNHPNTGEKLAFEIQIPDDMRYVLNEMILND